MNLKNFLLVSVVAALRPLTGCAVFNSLITAGLPTATFLLIKQYPQARAYVIDVSAPVSLRLLTPTRAKLSPRTTYALR